MPKKRNKKEKEEEIISEMLSISDKIEEIKGIKATNEKSDHLSLPYIDHLLKEEEAKENGDLEKIKDWKAQRGRMVKKCLRLEKKFKKLREKLHNL